MTSSVRPTSASSTNSPPKGGDSATFCCLDDPSPLDSSGECKTISFPFKVQVFHPQIHSRQDCCHQSSGHKHSWPSNTQLSQHSSRLLDIWNATSGISLTHTVIFIDT